MISHSNALRALLTSATLGIAAATAPAAHAAATFVIVNGDGAGEGFNDPTAAAPVGGNAGTTVGQQRLNAFQHAANIWGARLTSSVAIRVFGQWNALSCNAGGGTLGSAGFTNAFRDFSGAPVAGTWYAVALANALSGSDLDPGSNDISATFNSNWGTAGCAAASGWYYGLDGNAPSNRIDFVTVLLHELGHGLGFASLVDLGTGAKALGFNDTYMRLLENHGATPADYPSMTNGQRVAASISTGNLHWTGANVRAASGVLSAGKVGDHVRMFAPNPQQGGSSVSHFDTALTPDQLMEPSYTVPNHNPVLEIPLFQDIGWTASSPGGIANDLLIDFGSSGLYQRLNNNAWLKVHNTSPLFIAAGDLDDTDKDEAIASFSTGLWARFNNATWVKLHNTVPTRFAAGNVDGTAGDDLVVDFGASGVYIRYNNATWMQLTPAASQDIETGDLDGSGEDEIILDRGASGLWVRLNNTSWVKLHNLSPVHIAVGDVDGSGQDDAIIDFGSGNGIWIRFNNTTWTKLHNSTSQGITTGDFDGGGKSDILIDFGASGLWVRFNNATWVKWNNSSPVNTAAADLDSSGKSDAVIDFGGSTGLYVRYNNATWTKLTGLATQAIVGGGFD